MFVRDRLDVRQGRLEIANDIHALSPLGLICWMKLAGLQPSSPLEPRLANPMVIHVNAPRYLRALLILDNTASAHVLLE